MIPSELDTVRIKMESARIKNRIIIGLLGLSAVALICLNIYQYQAIRKIPNSGASGPADPVATAGNGDKGPDPSTGLSGIQAKVTGQTNNRDEDDVMYQLAAAKEELAAVNRQLSDHAAEAAEKKKNAQEINKDYLENQKKSIEDPAYRKTYKDSLDSLYGGLFSKLNLAPEKLDQLKEIMVDRNIAEINGSLKSQAGNDTAGEGQQTRAGTDSSSITDEFESRIAGLLGPEVYKTYRDYKNSWLERGYVKELMASLGDDEKLTDDQKEDLIKAMYEEANSVWSDMFANNNASSSETRGQRISRRMEYESRRAEAHLKAAKAILTASQYNRLESSIKRGLEERRLYLEKVQLSLEGNETGKDTDKGSE
jgi:hypothetical protein